MSLSALLAATMMSAAVQAAPTETEVHYVDLFERFCLSTGGQAAVAVGRADADGWARAPELIQPVPTAPVMDARVSVRPLADGSVRYFSLVTSSSPPGDKEAHVCVVDGKHAEPMRLDAVLALVTDAIGIEPIRQPGRFVWVISGQDPFVDERDLPASGADLFAVARTRSIYLIQLAMDGNQPAVFLMRAGP